MSVVSSFTSVNVGAPCYLVEVPHFHVRCLGVCIDDEVRVRVSCCLKELTKDTFSYYVLVFALISFLMHI